MGSLLCDSCKSNIIEERAEICISCGNPCDTGMCLRCRGLWPVERAAVFGEREGVLKTLIDDYKFSHKRAAVTELADLMGELLPFAMHATIVPIPTINRHIRERGYDHMSLLGRRVARRNRLTYAPLLVRHGSTVQHGASKQERLVQAEMAFTVNGVLDADMTYIIIDDITTTGASLKAAARVLRKAGARHIWTAALARQPLEEPLDERG